MKVNRYNRMYALGGMLKRYMMGGGRMYEHGGQYHDADGNPTDADGNRIPVDELVAVASDLEREAGLATDEGAALTGRDQGVTTEGVQDTGSTIATDEQATLMNPADAAAGTIASFNTDPVSPDMSQEQFDLAMQSGFVAKQFEGMDIQNPQQLSEAYDGFKNEVTTAINNNVPDVANSVRELAKTNQNFEIKLNKLAEDLGREPTDQDIADMMIDMNTDGLFGDLHGVVVDQFLPSKQLNSTPITQTFRLSTTGRNVDKVTINGQNISEGGSIITSIQDKGIKNREGTEKLFQDATDAGIDLTKGTIQTEDFLRGWYTDSANADFIVTAGGAEEMAAGGVGVKDVSATSGGNLAFLNTMVKEAVQEANSKIPSFAQAAKYRDLRDRLGQEAADAYAEEKGFIYPSFAMGGKYKVLKGGGRAPMGALSALLRR